MLACAEPLPALSFIAVVIVMVLIVMMVASWVGIRWARTPSCTVVTLIPRCLLTVSSVIDTVSCHLIAVVWGRTIPVMIPRMSVIPIVWGRCMNRGVPSKCRCKGACCPKHGS